MPNAVLLVHSNCPADQEKAFNHWYDTVHVPDILGVEGFVAAQRFKLAGPGPQTVTRDGQPAVAQYLALYELDTDDTGAAMKRLGHAVTEFQQRGRLVDAIHVVSGATHA